jgi:hypothetical protein
MRLLLAGATLSFTTAASHAAISVSVGHAHGLETASVNAVIATILLTALLIVWGLYALSASGSMKPLPMVKPAIYGITAIYLVRGLFLLPQLLGYNIFADVDPVTGYDLLFSAFVLVVGAIHMAGVTQRDL